MHAVRARPEGGHGEAPVRRPANVLLCARLGRFHLPRRPGRALPTGGGPAGSASSASVRLCGRRPVFSSSAPRARPSCRSRLRGSGEIRSLAWDPSSLASRRSGGLPASPSAPPLRGPDAVTPRAVPLAARSQPRPLIRPGGRSVASRRTRVRCLGPKTGWRPAGPQLATARFRRVTFHPYKGETAASSVARRSEEKSGSLRYPLWIRSLWIRSAGCPGGR
jgi:hypothetical protein